MNSNGKYLSIIVVFALVILWSPVSLEANNINRDLREKSIATMLKAATLFYTEVASYI